MKKVINYLISLALIKYFIFISFSIVVYSQTLDNLQTEAKIFGWSLKQTDKKKKEKTKLRKQNNQLAHTNNDEIIRVDTIMVMNEVLVFDKNGNQVKGLTKEDFVVREDNQIQEISTFLSGDNETIPRSIVLIIDYSFSQLPYIETSVEAAKVLVDKLNQNDRMSIVTDNVEMMQEFTTDKKLLKEKLELLKINTLSGQVSSSKQYSALMVTLNEMFNDESVRPIIIFQTDGDQLLSLKGQIGNNASGNEKPIEFTYEDILTAAEKKQATIYPIISGISFKNVSKKEKMLRAKLDYENNQKSAAKLKGQLYDPAGLKINEGFLENRAEWLIQRQKMLGELGEKSGGWTEYLEQPEQAEKIYSEILFRMNQRYLLGYYPTNQERSEKIRHLKIEVSGHPEYKIIGRKTYILAENFE